MTDDATQESELRAFLARRAPSTAPAGLVETVRDRLRTDTATPRLAWLRPALGGLVGFAGLVLLAAVALVQVRTGPGPGASNPPAPPQLAVGNGIVEAAPPIVQLGLAAAAVIGLVIVVVRTRRRLVGYAAVLAVVGVVWLGSALGAVNGLGSGSGAFALEPSIERPEGFSEGVFVAADGDTEFRIMLAVRNASSLPLDLDGLAPAPPLLPDPSRYARLAGLGYLPADDCCLPSNARPFTRMTLQPDESVQLVVLGNAGACAQSTVDAGAVVVESVPLVYEQLTIQHRAEVVLPESVEVLTRGGC